MQRKLAFLFWAFSALISVNQAYAQSSHDAIQGADPDLPKAGGNDFTFGSTDGKYRLRIRGHVQENNQFTYFSNGGKKDVKLEIKRARFSFTGNAIDPRLTYLFQAGYENESTGAPSRRNVLTAPGSNFLRDYYFNMELNEHFQARIGKFRTPFSRQQLMSTSQMQFYDQSEANDEFQLTDTGRDVGVLVHNGFHNPIEWAFAVVSNGLVARIGMNHNGIDGYEMTDFTGGDLRFAVAANGFLKTKYSVAKIDDVRGGVDFIAKVASFSTNGAFYYQFLKREGQNEGTNNYGGGADFGYLIHRKYEPVVRYSWVKRAGDQEAHHHEALAGLNYYLYGHHLKVQGYGGAELSNKDFYKWLGGVQFQFAL